MRRFLPALLFAARFASAQPAIGPPPAGFIRDFQNSLRPVIGIAGNFLLGDSIGEGVDSFAFSGLTGLVKMDSSVQVLDRQGQSTYSTAAAAGPALFAFAADGTPAFTYLVSTGAVLIWRTDHFDAAQWEIGDTVLAIANPSAGVLAAIVEREDGLWELDLDASTGRVISQTAVSPAHGPAFLTGTGVLLHSEAPGALIEQMDKNWIHVLEPASHKHYAVRLEHGRKRRFQLPEAQP